jgi:hypothetical protein
MQVLLVLCQSTYNCGLGVLTLMIFIVAQVKTILWHDNDSSPRGRQAVQNLVVVAPDTNNHRVAPILHHASVCLK